MKKLTLLVTALFFANVSLANPMAPAYAQASVTEYDAVYISKTQKVTPVKKHEENENLHCNIDVTYPQISGKNLSTAEQKFNSHIIQIINQEIEQFKNRVKRDIPNIRNLPKEVQNNSFNIDYDLDVIHPLSLISVRLTMQGMQAGRAHPYRTHRVLNFDLINNKELALSDLFKPKSNYLEAIANYSHKKLDQTVQESDKWMIEEGAKAHAKNYRNWNIEKDAILITFDEYQVAPYVYGPQEVEIPFSELQHLLSTQAKIISSIKNETNNIG